MIYTVCKFYMVSSLKYITTWCLYLTYLQNIYMAKTLFTIFYITACVVQACRCIYILSNDDCGIRLLHSIGENRIVLFKFQHILFKRIAHSWLFKFLNNIDRMTGLTGNVTGNGKPSFKIFCPVQQWQQQYQDSYVVK